MDPATCQHPEFVARVDVNRITGDVEGGQLTNLYVELRANCAACNVPLVFHGLPVGLSPRQPTVNVMGEVLTAPARPATEPEGWGQDGPSVAVSVHGPGVVHPKEN